MKTEGIVETKSEKRLTVWKPAKVVVERKGVWKKHAQAMHALAKPGSSQLRIVMDLLK